MRKHNHQEKGIYSIIKQNECNYYKNFFHFNNHKYKQEKFIKKPLIRHLKTNKQLRRILKKQIKNNKYSNIY